MTETIGKQATAAVLEVYHKHEGDAYALAEEVLRLEAENERLRAALEPFAKVAWSLIHYEDGGMTHMTGATAGDYRKAAAALQK